MRHAIAQDHPLLVCVGDVDGFIAFQTVLLQDRHGHLACVIAENAAWPARWIFGPAQSDEKHGAERDPRKVDCGEAESARVWQGGPYNNGPMTRSEIEQQLITIVRQEKPNLLDEKLTAETALADAGIDSLDALTILFAIEEHFKISIPDDKARAMKTFGDMITTVEQLVPSTT